MCHHTGPQGQSSIAGAFPHYQLPQYWSQCSNLHCTDSLHGGQQWKWQEQEEEEQQKCFTKGQKATKNDIGIQARSKTDERESGLRFS